MMRRKSFFGVLLVLFTICGKCFAMDRFITVASTTSTEISGLYDVLLPKFTEISGIDVRVVAVGTGKAIMMAERGDADVLLVHHKHSEEEFVTEGFGLKRYDLMYNDFVIVGPSNDLADIGESSDVVEALGKIAAGKNLFVSRGDESGTHKKELSLWKAAGVKISDLENNWYQESGSGMGATLNIASGKGGYTITDRATWLKFVNKGDLRLLVEGDSKLFNQYGVVLVNPEKHSHVKAADGQVFIDWLLSSSGQMAINAYQVKGQQAFFANAAAAKVQ